MKCKLILISSLAMAILPLVANADITIVNNSKKSVATSKVIGIKASPCSDKTGPAGVINKNGGKSVMTKFIFDTIMYPSYCEGSKTDCEAVLFMSNNCSGDMVASVKFNKKMEALGPIANHSDKYNVTMSGNTIMIADK